MIVPRQNEYTGIDYFRLIAAVLVVAVHTSPLSEFNGTADFVLTRVLARVAVPFFFMASGFFLFSKTEDGSPRSDKLLAFLKKTGLLYLIAILLYLPINAYAGTLQEWQHLPRLLKDIVFNGTFYHLWYLPAAITGACIAWLLLRKLKTGQALIVSTILYLIGMFGDSYYGIAAQIPFLEASYQHFFSLFDYTRNGLFFSPVFFVLGALIARRAHSLSLRVCLAGLGVSVVLMLTEGLLLYRSALQRHDSMYFLLLPCMFFLFQSLLYWEGKSRKHLRNLSMLIYLIHPAMIVAVRGFATVTRLPGLLIDNSIIHYTAVLSGSFAAALILAVVLNTRHKQDDRQERTDRAWAEINMANVQHNVEVLRREMPEQCEIIAVVKANAYGHGDVEISLYLNSLGIYAFAVATIDEGINLRQKGVKGEILILGYTAPSRASELCRFTLSQTVVDAKYAEDLNRYGKPLQVHIKVNTGMNRLGESFTHTTQIASVFGCKNLRVTGIFTHLCVSDSNKTDDLIFTNQQIQDFYGLLEGLKAKHIQLPKVHIQSSYGILNYPELVCSYARIGIALYGVLSNPDPQTKLLLDLRPVLTLKSRVSLVREVKPGESVGYGREYVAQKESKIAVISIGFADGFPRNLSQGTHYVLIRGCCAPIVGRICMDQLMVDVTALPDIKRDDIVTLIGKNGSQEITAEQTADDAGTITNELLSRLSARLERLYIYDP